MLKISNTRFTIPQAIAPNPVINVASIFIQSEAAKEIELIITDATGRQVYQKPYFLHKGYNSFSIDLTRQLPGFYIMQVKEKNGLKHNLPFLKR